MKIPAVYRDFLNYPNDGILKKKIFIFGNKNYEKTNSNNAVTQRFRKRTSAIYVP